MPTELAIPRVRRYLLQEDIRDELVVMASGGIRTAHSDDKAGAGKARLWTWQGTRFLLSLFTSAVLAFFDGVPNSRKASFLPPTAKATPPDRIDQINRVMLPKQLFSEPQRQ